MANHQEREQQADRPEKKTNYKPEQGAVASPEAYVHGDNTTDETNQEIRLPTHRPPCLCQVYQMPYAGPAPAAAALLDHRNQTRGDNPLVGSQKSQAMDAGGGDNHPVTRVAQRVAQGGHFAGDVHREGNDPKRRIGVQFMEHLIQRDAEPLPPLVQQYDFKQAESTDAHALSTPFGILNDPALFARQFPRRIEPTEQDVGIEQKSRIQEAGTSIAP